VIIGVIHRKTMMNRCIVCGDYDGHSPQEAELRVLRQISGAWSDLQVSMRGRICPAKTAQKRSGLLDAGAF